MVSLLLAASVLASSQGLQLPNNNLESLLDVALLIKGGAAAENMLGAIGEGQVRQQYPISTDTALNARVQNAFDRLLNTSGTRRNGLNYSVTVISGNTINAFALPGGRINVFEGLVRSMTDDELLFVLGHELTHTNKAHGVNGMRQNLFLGIGLAAFGKKTNDLTTVLSALANFASAKHSRDQENEADRDGFADAIAAGANPMAPLAAMRRLETLDQNQPGLLSALFASHPPTPERSAKLKRLGLESEYGAPLVTLVAADSVKIGTVKTYDATDPTWQRDYTAMTGQPVYHPSNYYAIGECTWCAQALRPEDLPRSAAGTNNACNWFDHAQAANYGGGQEPKFLAIGVWNNRVGSGAGHVATVGMVYGQTIVGFWDANWSPKLDHKVRYRVVDISKEKNFVGFIYWPNSQMEPPGGSSPPFASARPTIELLNDPMYLGDGRNAGLKPNTDWHRLFDLNTADTNQAAQAHLELDLNAVPRKDPVISINGHEVYRAVAQGQGWHHYQTPSFATSLLRSGQNLVDLETIVMDARQGFDECWVRHLTLVFDR